MHKEESQIRGKDCDFTAKLSSEKKNNNKMPIYPSCFANAKYRNLKYAKKTVGNGSIRL